MNVQSITEAAVHMVTVRMTPEATPVPAIQDILATDSIVLVSELQ